MSLYSRARRAVLARWQRMAPTDRLIEKIAAAEESADATPLLDGLRERLAYQDGSLEGVDWSGACLDGATLSACCLSGADLSGASLRSAYFGYTDLRRARLRGADFRERICARRSSWRQTFLPPTCGA